MLFNCVIQFDPGNLEARTVICWMHVHHKAVLKGFASDWFKSWLSGELVKRLSAVHLWKGRAPVS